MGRESEIVKQFLSTEQGFDNESRPGARFADGAPSAQSVADEVSTLMIQLTVAAAASLDVNLFKASASGNEALPAQLTNPTGETYRDIVRYAMCNPNMIRGLSIATNENPDTAAPVLASMKILPQRRTPFGYSCTNEILVQNSQTSQDFRVNMTQVALTYPLDGFNYLQVTTGANPHADAVVLTLNFQIGQRIEKIRDLSAARPVVNRPGGLGPIAVR